jgi:DNA-binding beta-propeller fold protein YncE
MSPTSIGALSVIDTRHRAVVADIDSVVSPVGSALSPEQNKLYVVNHQTSAVSVIDTTLTSRSRLCLGCFNPLDVKADTVLHKAL